MQAAVRLVGVYSARDALRPHRSAAQLADQGLQLGALAGVAFQAESAAEATQSRQLVVELGEVEGAGGLPGSETAPGEPPQLVVELDGPPRPMRPESGRARASR